jgi:hypothetical protein
MANKVVWDALGERLYEAGLDRGVLYTQKLTDPYGNGVPFNGLTEMTEKPSGAELTDLFADDIKYASIRAAETFGATMGALCYPDEFAECDGSVEAEDGVYLGQQTRKPFGLCYRTKIGDDQHDSADKGYKLHLLYGLSAAPSERAYNPINDSPDATTFSWEISSTPIAVAGYKPVSNITIDSTKADATKLAALEAILYGTAAADAVGEVGQEGYVAAVAAVDARMPMPSEVLALMGE